MDKRETEERLREIGCMGRDIKYCGENNISTSEELVAKQRRYRAHMRWIDSLSYTEKLIVFEFYVKGRSWAEISMRIEKSESYCRAVRNIAVDRLMKSAEDYI